MGGLKMKNLNFEKHHLKYDVLENYKCIGYKYDDIPIYQGTGVYHTNFYEGEEETFKTKRFGFLWLKKIIIKEIKPKFAFRVEADIESGEHTSEWWKKRIKFRLELNRGHLL